MTNEGAGLNQAASWLRAARRVVVFTGAGVSQESGIATFRETGGLWDKFPPERFATWGGLMATAATHPRELAEFLLAVLEPVARAVPNSAHRAIAELEKHADVVVVTQNVDALHQEAGSSCVHEVHGSLFEVVTLGGKLVRRVNRSEMLQIVEAIRGTLDHRFVLPRLLAAVNPVLGLGPVIHRPRIVLFGEAMAEPAWTKSIEAARSCDLLLVVGTSGEVYPAATIPLEAHRTGAKVVGVGPEPGDADAWLTGPAGEVVPKLLESAYA